MTRRTFARLVGSAAALPGLPAPAAPGPAPAVMSLDSSCSPFDVSDRAQLFVDQVLVRETRNVSYTLHPAEKDHRNPLVRADRPWEGWRLEIYGTVLYDEDERIFKMWYIGESPGYFAETPNPTLYATSQDGIHWEKPLVGTLRAVSGGPHNAVAPVELASVIKDKREPDQDRRYKMICWAQQPRSESGYHTMISPDGLNWKRLSTRPIAPSGDVITGYYDEDRGLYVAYPKIGTKVRGHSRRVFYLITSQDFEHWSEPKLAFTPDLRDDAGALARIEEARPILDVPDNPKLMRTEFYGIGVYPHESCLLAFPWMFTINNNARYGNHEGPFELQLAVSRDLENWQRPFRVPCVPRGKLGEWDQGLFVTPCRALRVADEIWLYYGGSNYTHGTPCLYRAEGTGRHTRFTGSIGLAKWKLDRFVSVDGPAEGGALTTVPVQFSGDTLELNAAVQEGGSLEVEILDAAGRPLPEFGRSDIVRGDHLRKAVTWRGENALGRLRGKPVSLKFHLKRAALFSFAFRNRRA